MIWIVLFVAGILLAYANGANDNYKGVATLLGSGTCRYREALWWGTGTTFLGSVCSIFLADLLLQNFSGKGLVPDATAATPAFLCAVALGAGITVLLAALLGFPISTTHSLTGGLAGAGFAAVGWETQFGVLGVKFFLPLLVSPFLAVLAAGILYLILRYLRIKAGITKEMCVCVAESEPSFVPASTTDGTLLTRSSTGSTSAPFTMPQVLIRTQENCQVRYAGKILGMNSQKLLDVFHYISAGAVSFARGLNDTPKVAALMIAAGVFGGSSFGAFFGVAVGMAVGGLLSARKVAETMSRKITPLNHGQGFTSNMVTAVLVIGASLIGNPVSTTHVSVGSLFGIGTVTREADPRTVYQILLSWVLTLPIAAGLSYVCFGILV